MMKNKKEWLKSYRHRSDATTYLTHLTRGENGKTSIQVLKQILDDKKIIANNKLSFVVDNSIVVSFMDCTLYSTAQQTFFNAINKKEGTLLEYEPVGLIFNKSYAFSTGYNSDRGGGFKKTIYQYEIGNPEPIATYDTLEEASNSVGASRKTISNACLGSLKSAKGLLWSYTPEYPIVEDKRSKTVYQYDLDGLLIATFSSAREASRQLNIGLSSITRCCRGERKQTSGYQFTY